MADGSKLTEKDFWNHTPQEIGAALGCGLEGLGSQEAGQRLDQYGPNSDADARADSLLRAVLRRLLEPLSLILLVAGIISILTGDTIGGSIIVLILTMSIGLDTVQEGHAVKTAEILRRSVRVFDICARFGGEEFAILVEDCSLSKAVDIAESLRVKISGLQFATKTGPMTVTCSFGVSERQRDGSIDQLLKCGNRELRCAAEDEIEPHGAIESYLCASLWLTKQSS